MSKFDWSDLDARLLQLLVAVVEVGSITGAAQRLGVTQSAVSHLLDKLRVITGDPLLKPFADTVAAHGTNYPASNINPKSVPDVQLTIGQAWSAVIGKQSDPAAAAQQAFGRVKPLLG